MCLEWLNDFLEKSEEFRSIKDFNNARDVSVKLMEESAQVYRVIDDEIIFSWPLQMNRKYVEVVKKNFFNRCKKKLF